MFWKSSESLEIFTTFLIFQWNFDLIFWIFLKILDKTVLA